MPVKLMGNTYDKYSFLFKPVFFIFCLLSGSWIVLKIEKLSPSDFGRYKSLFEKEDSILPDQQQKPRLKKLINDYKTGSVDSAMFETKLEEFFRHKKKDGNER